MVKFSKELEAQLIPEWKDAFVNYWQLKKHVKKVKLSRKPTKHHVPETSYDYGLSIFDPIRLLARRITCGTGVHSPENIQVKSRITVGKNGEEEGEFNETGQLFSEEDEVNMFFEMLDDELTKVNQFYTTKEKEFLERGELLNKQLQILLNLKRVLSDGRRKNQPANTAANSGFLSRSGSSSGGDSDFSDSQINECCESPIDTQTDDIVAALEKNGINFVNSTTRAKMNKVRTKTTTRIDIPMTTPTQTIAAVTSLLWEDLVNNPKKGGNGGEHNNNRKKIQCAEKMIRRAFMELYRGLGLLKTYSSLNMVAFTKILKKFDKVLNQQASANYLKLVKRSHFISSDKVVGLIDGVECLFTQHFANSDRKNAMKFLRPHHHKDSHMVTFFVGLFTGSFVTLFSVYAILAHLSGMFSPRAETAYMETVYPIFSMFALLSLHLFMYGCNLFMWRTTRINHNFIFEFQPTTALKYRDAFLICACLMTCVVGAMVLHLILLSTGFSPHRVDSIPGILLVLCPASDMSIEHLLSADKVLLVDFFMADQLTSQIPLLRHMESAACYFLTGSFKTHRYGTCKSGKLYTELAYVISFAPYYWRAMQCARRWFDEYNTDHLANLGKYVSAMVAAGARLTYARQPSQLWMVIVLVTSLVATVYQLYWDFVKDWGLLNPKSKNHWLRDDLVLKNRGIYYGSIALNFVLRVAWMETVMKFHNGVLENEHLNNVGKFRAVKTVPLPFHETGL
ncbi:hypothetical protein OROHE_016612 [Orobanche hederae]